MACILAIGIATLDIINSVAVYPQEDAEVRASAQEIRRGGNATNTLSVLSDLGHACHWGGVWVDEANGHIIRDELTASGIAMSACRCLTTGKMPISYITLNRANGSRTIVHYRDLPEFSFTDFERIDLSHYDWLHFEGRNVVETQKMLIKARAANIKISLEIEKPRENIECLWQFADILLFAKAFVQAHAPGLSPPAFLQKVRRHVSADVFCTWGESGAFAMPSNTSDLLYCPANIPPQVVDTLGAGDTFNAGIIDAQVRGLSMLESLNHAVHLAGEKCGRVGLWKNTTP